MKHGKKEGKRRLKLLDDAAYNVVRLNVGRCSLVQTAVCPGRVSHATITARSNNLVTIIELIVIIIININYKLIINFYCN